MIYPIDTFFLDGIEHVPARALCKIGQSFLSLRFGDGKAHPHLISLGFIAPNTSADENNFRILRNHILPVESHVRLRRVFGKICCFDIFEDGAPKHIFIVRIAVLSQPLAGSLHINLRA